MKSCTPAWFGNKHQPYEKQTAIFSLSEVRPPRRQRSETGGGSPIAKCWACIEVGCVGGHNTCARTCRPTDPSGRPTPKSYHLQRQQTSPDIAKQQVIFSDIVVSHESVSSVNTLSLTPFTTINPCKKTPPGMQMPLATAKLRSARRAVLLALLLEHTQQKREGRFEKRHGRQHGRSIITVRYIV